MTLLVFAACGTEPAGPADPVDTPEGDLRYDYEDDGVACVRTVEGDEVEILVDFGDCLYCSSQDVACEVATDGARIDVSAGGSVLVQDPCLYRDTCNSVTTRCAAVGLAEGAWTLSYGGTDVAVELPSEDWVCTGPTAVL